MSKRKCRFPNCRVIICGRKLPAWCLFPFILLTFLQCLLVYQTILFVNSTVTHKSFKDSANIPVPKEKQFTIAWFRLYHNILTYHTSLIDWENCEYSNCKLVFRNFIGGDAVVRLGSDAVLFQGNNLYPTLVERSHVDQVFVFVSYEPPSYLHSDMYKSPQWDGIFNWTMTYRLDSDIPYRYGEIIRGKDNRTKNYAKVFQEKQKMAAWVVSHCNSSSNREAYVEKLQHYIDIDTFGDCFGGLNCSREQQNVCFDLIEKEYKFYLAFENSFCHYYITEKAYNWTTRNIIPVVRGPPGYEVHLPRGSYINTADFKTVEDLAYFLLEVGGDERLYTEYLRAREGYILRSMYDQPQSAYCKLCEKLNNLETNRKSYESISYWWNRAGVCWNATDIR